MNRRGTQITAAVLIAAALSGCASMQRKFTRKKKEEPKRSVVYIDEGQYKKKFSNDYYYKSHYTLWKSWQSDWMDLLGGNNKKLERAAQETVGHLESLHGYLKDEKAAELAPMLEELKKMRVQVESGHPSRSEQPAMRGDLERLKRLVANDFYYDRIKDDLKSDELDLSVGGVS